MIGLVLLCGCEIKSWMIGQIVQGELNKVRKARPHRVLFDGVFPRAGSEPLEVGFHLRFCPTEVRVYTVDTPEELKGLQVWSSPEKYMLYDPKQERAEVVKGLPPFDARHFKSFRKRVLGETLQENRIFVGKSKREDGRFWKIRVEPRFADPFLGHIVSYIEKETRTNLETTEYSREGRMLSRFITRKTIHDVEFGPDDLSITLPDGVDTWELDLGNSEGWKEPPKDYELRAPEEVEGMTLQRFRQCEGGGGLFDYIEDGEVLVYAVRPRKGEMLSNPISKEIQFRGIPIYISAVGRYLVVKWEDEQDENLLLTNLGPATLRTFLDKTVPKPE